uniref:Uncharacterized protein n=1 Tax=Moniliophthora roreri TaxID=221103 RepID=A0A0W0FWC3_MONRR
MAQYRVKGFDTYESVDCKGRLRCGTSGVR